MRRKRRQIIGIRAHKDRNKWRVDSGEGKAEQPLAQSGVLIYFQSREQLLKKIYTGIPTNYRHIHKSPVLGTPSHNTPFISL